MRVTIKDAESFGTVSIDVEAHEEDSLYVVVETEDGVYEGVLKTSYQDADTVLDAQDSEEH